MEQRITVWQRMSRKKVLSVKDMISTDLNRCLTTLDLIGLGIGSTLGAGLYVVAGQVALQHAGPSVTVSFLVAAVASAFAGMCYAEFAARIPRAGSAYVYSYVSVGELMAFVIGWNLILEYIIGTASVARGASSYIDALADKKISHWFNSTMHIGISTLSPYPDLLAFVLTMIITVLLVFGIKESARLNNLFTAVNLLVVLYVCGCGVFKIKWHNWNLSPEKDHLPDSAGSGGFFPFGFSGMMAGASTCFYAFVGFDCVATTGEECLTPQYSIPRGIVISLVLIFFSYFSVSAIVTLMWPYYLLDPDAWLPTVFKDVGWSSAQYIISSGAICSLITSLVGALLPLPRVLYAMAEDGVLFKFMGRVNERLKTPLFGTFLSGLFAAVMAMMFDLKELVDMMSIGTLLAYTLVALSVLILRYEPTDQEEYRPISSSVNSNEKEDVTESLESDASTWMWSELFFPLASFPTEKSAKITKYVIAVMCFFLTVLTCFLRFAAAELGKVRWWAILICAVLFLVIVMCVVSLYRQHQSSAKLAYTVPFVPLLPALSGLINIYLMWKLSTATWIRFGVWMVIGFLIYFTYGLRKSNPNKSIESLQSIDDA